MSLSLYFILVIFFLFIALAVTVSKSSPSNDIYSEISTEEWLCPICGFEVQVGDICIYCDTPKGLK
ncbi:MAG: hypothetical protein ACJZ15_05580 [Candidatus Neomarinimicrobiota bacterium]|tara:strand:+ start:2426 stop:2623 length:198 start_codon:yes stop_codon:yes gene_type:complete